MSEILHNLTTKRLALKNKLRDSRDMKKLDPQPAIPDILKDIERDRIH